MNTKIKGQFVQYDANGLRISARCPSCLQQGILDPINVPDVAPQNTGTPVFGQRRCPNPNCMQHIFFVSDRSTSECFPPERLDFDATDIPKPLVSSFTEAIACHSVECYIASALMIRRTLEELCKDRGATGKNLKERLASLGTKVVLPTELLEALDHLRLLGNDAAHIESQEYDKVGKPEVEIAIEFTKEVLKAVYQYSGLLGKLKGLKKSPTP